MIDTKDIEAAIKVFIDNEFRLPDDIKVILSIPEAIKYRRAADQMIKSNKYSSTAVNRLYEERNYLTNLVTDKVDEGDSIDRTDYYSLFKNDVKRLVAANYKDVIDLTAQITNMEKNLDFDKSSLANIETQISEHERDVDAITGTPQQYQKHKDTEKALNSEKDRLVNAISKLTNTIPIKQQDLAEAKNTLAKKLDDFLIKSRQLPENKINRMQNSCVNERADFLDCYNRLYNDYGLTAPDKSSWLKHIERKKT
jgi:DNA repair ATPase RecN